MVSTAPPNVTTDAWVKADWAEFLTVAAQFTDEKARFYYDNHAMRVETTLIGSGHSQANTILTLVVTLYCMAKNIRIVGFTNGSFRQAGVRECQPDLAFYVGDDFQIPPKTSQPIEINEFGAPHLVIEVAATTLNDDLGRKRLLYERLGVQEYWVVDVESGEVIAFAVSDGGSRQIQVSQVLPALPIAIVEQALTQSQIADDRMIHRWLWQTFQQ
ncbi:Uma2 family endonuclease [Synechococcus sp. C9]|uniref:Uma2 family endonuclease n=1 Tax=Synechococcus sp. C9 TaxID=102119 RepID=UPI001FF251F9|nr:Uma2 family endonuclease [Synechococcus sp. C9]